jgi:hypothetical protein
LEGAGTAGNFAKIGQELIDLGHLPLKYFEELLQQLLWNRRYKEITELQRLVQGQGAQPVYWMHDVNNYLEWCREGLLQDNFVVASDLSAKFGEETARVLMQRLVRRLGELLIVWTELRQAAMRLRQRGVEFGRQI